MLPDDWDLIPSPPLRHVGFLLLHEMSDNESRAGYTRGTGSIGRSFAESTAPTEVASPQTVSFALPIEDTTMDRIQPSGLGRPKGLHNRLSTALVGGALLSFFAVSAKRYGFSSKGVRINLPSSMGGVGMVAPFFQTSLPSSSDLEEAPLPNPRGRKDRHTRGHIKPVPPVSAQPVSCYPRHRPPKWARLNGRQGSWTNDDDVAPECGDFIPCGYGLRCDIKEHQHRRKRTGKAPLSGAARRHLERQVRDGVKPKTSPYVQCELPTQICPRAAEEHFHFFLKDAEEKGLVEAPALRPVPSTLQVPVTLVDVQTKSLPEIITDEPVVPLREQVVIELKAVEHKTVVQPPTANLKTGLSKEPEPSSHVGGDKPKATVESPTPVVNNDVSQFVCDHKHRDYCPVDGCGEYIDECHEHLHFEYSSSRPSSSGALPLFDPPPHPEVHISEWIDFPRDQDQIIEDSAWDQDSRLRRLRKAYRRWVRKCEQADQKESRELGGIKSHPVKGRRPCGSPPADAPPAIEVKGDFATREVLLYYKSGVPASYGGFLRFKRWLRSGIPWIQTVQRVRSNKASAVDRSGDQWLWPMVEEGYVFSLNRQRLDYLNPISLDKSDATSVFLIGQGYDSCSKALIFDELLVYLRSWSTQEGGNLQRRNPGKRSNKHGNIELNTGFVDAVHSLLSRYPKIEEMSVAQSEIVQNTVLFYVQQRLIDYARSVAALPTETGVSFGRAGRH